MAALLFIWTATKWNKRQMPTKTTNIFLSAPSKAQCSQSDPSIYLYGGKHTRVLSSKVSTVFMACSSGKYNENSGLFIELPV